MSSDPLHLHQVLFKLLSEGDAPAPEEPKDEPDQSEEVKALAISL